MLTITTRPQKVIEGSFVSKWNAAFNRLVFGLQRQDFTVDNVFVIPSGIFAGSVAMILAPPLPAFGTVIIGDKIYLKSGTHYNGPATVQGVFGGAIILESDIANGSAVGGFANFLSERLNYRAELRLLKDNGFGVWESITEEPVNYKPDNTGLA